MHHDEGYHLKALGSPRRVVLFFATELASDGG